MNAWWSGGVLLAGECRADNNAMLLCFPTFNCKSIKSLKEWTQELVEYSGNVSSTINYYYYSIQSGGMAVH